MDATDAVKLLQASKFDRAEARANDIVKMDPSNSVAHAIAAVTLYKRTMHALVDDLFALAVGLARSGINHRYAAFAVEQADAGLAKVDEHLAAAAADPQFQLRQCLACWKVDWDHDGEIDRGDVHMLEIEVDANGDRIAAEDPRRRPTFQFDVGDLHWARAMLSFQRALLNLVYAYRWDALHSFVRNARRSSSDTKVFSFPLRDKARVLKARELILAGLEHADATRRAYLAETDDRDEWVPNPRQRSHPMPLPVDAALYETWEGVVRDVRALLRSEEGLDIAQLAQLGDHTWQDPPRGFLDIGKLLAEPGDLNLNKEHFDRLDALRQAKDVESLLREVFGAKYVQTMKPSPLIGRFHRIKRELDHGKETFERKLRYLFWLN